ncbi:hypothetical protein [Acinetobacter larvae]|nr:hypothetical protein [Acinetobacter larvae]
MKLKVERSIMLIGLVQQSKFLTEMDFIFCDKKPLIHWNNAQILRDNAQ